MSIVSQWINITPEEAYRTQINVVLFTLAVKPRNKFLPTYDTRDVR